MPFHESASIRDLRPHTIVKRHKVKYIEGRTSLGRRASRIERRLVGTGQGSQKSKDSLKDKAEKKSKESVSANTQLQVKSKDSKDPLKQEKGSNPNISQQTQSVRTGKETLSGKQSPKTTQLEDQTGDSKKDLKTVKSNATQSGLKSPKGSNATDQENSESKKEKLSGKTETEQSQVSENTEQKKKAAELGGSQASNSLTSEERKKALEQTQSNSVSAQTQTQTQEDGLKSVKDNDSEMSLEDDLTNSQSEMNSSMAEKLEKAVSEEQKSATPRDDESFDQDAEAENEEESVWSSDGGGKGNRFAGYSQEEMDKMDGFLARIKYVYEYAQKLEEPIMPEDVEINFVTEDHYLEFRKPGQKHFVMHLTLEFKPDSGMYYAVMESDDFVDKARSVLYISPKRIEDQHKHLIGHYLHFETFYDKHVTNKRKFSDFISRLDNGFRVEFGAAYDPKIRKVVNLQNYKWLKFHFKGENIPNTELPMINVLNVIIFKLNAKHFMVELKGEVHEVKMMVKAFLEEAEFTDVINKLVRTAFRNNSHEFAWITVPEMIENAVKDLVETVNADEEDGEFLEVLQLGTERQFDEHNNIIQYQVKHVPGDDEDMDELILIDVDCYLYKDEFLPSVYFAVNSAEYESQYLIPFTGNSGDFYYMILESVRSAYNTIKKIVFDLADIDEQDIYEYSRKQVVDMIKEGIVRAQNLDEEEGQYTDEDVEEDVVAGMEEDEQPYAEYKLYIDKKNYFTLHDITMEEGRLGYLVSCFNLNSTKGELGEYRIYAKNYYDWTDDFKMFMEGCQKDRQ